MTDPAFRRQGIARSLMEKAIDRRNRKADLFSCWIQGKKDPSNLLYASLGFAEAGRIPAYAESADGGFDASVFIIKKL